MKAKVNKSKLRKVYRFRDTNWNMIRNDATKLNDILLGHFDSNDVDTNWKQLKIGIVKVMDTHVPSKMTS